MADERDDSGTVSANRVHRASGWRVVFLWLVSAAMKLWCGTLRVRIGVRDREALENGDRSVMILLWHNRLFLVPWMVRHLRRGHPVYAMVSASRDGANLARFFEFCGVRTVRGSSSRLGRRALRELIAAQRRGFDMAITPDGPRGPVYSLKEGAMMAARVTGSPLILFGIQYANAWRLRSWDRFCLPKPFSCVTIRCERLEPDAIGQGPSATGLVRSRLLALCGEPEPAE